jgi:hypothetical protein
MTTTDPDTRMPPPDSGKHAISPAELAIVRDWIAAGAEYKPHWAFVAPTRHEAPAGNTAWTRDPIDSFVAARLESAGLSPSPEAAPETLARRVFLDLTGLPPTPEELAAFLGEWNAERDGGRRPSGPDAYDRLVSRLLTTEPYRTRHAERMAVPWLDLARYADTSGIHMDAGRSIWPYRDWVLAAYRDNMPFDRFVIEQLAGDLLPGATDDQRIASGFHRNHVTSDEGGDRCRVPARVRGRSRGDDRSGVSRAHHAVRPLPRPQVRSGHRRGLLLAHRVLQLDRGAGDLLAGAR